MGRWAGHTFPQSLALAARAGWGEMAREQIRLFHDHFLAPNGLHLNGDWRHAGITILGTNVFCMEANCGLAGTVPEMLLQSWARHKAPFNVGERVALHRCTGTGGFPHPDAGSGACDGGREQAQAAP